MFVCVFFLSAKADFKEIYEEITFPSFLSEDADDSIFVKNCCNLTERTGNIRIIYVKTKLDFWQDFHKNYLR